MEKILFGRECHVVHWLTEGYEALVKRGTYITMTEEEQLGVDSTLQLYRLRDQYQCNGRRLPSGDMVRNNFAIEWKAAQYPDSEQVKSPR